MLHHAHRRLRAFGWAGEASRWAAERGVSKRLLLLHLCHSQHEGVLDEVAAAVDVSLAASALASAAAIVRRAPKPFAHSAKVATTNSINRVIDFPLLSCRTQVVAGYPWEVNSSASSRFPVSLSFGCPEFKALCVPRVRCGGALVAKTKW